MFVAKLKREVKTRWFWFRVSTILFGVLASLLYVFDGLSYLSYGLNMYIAGTIGGFVGAAVILLIYEIKERNHNKGGKYCVNYWKVNRY